MKRKWRNSSVGEKRIASKIGKMKGNRRMYASEDMPVFLLTTSSPHNPDLFLNSRV